MPLGRTTLVATLAAALLLLTGCTGRVIDAGDASVLVGRKLSSGMHALGGGELAVVGGCLGFGDTVVVWPYGTNVVDEDPLTIDLPGTGEVSLGESVEVGGGYVLEHNETDPAGPPYEFGGVEVPAACAEHAIFLASTEQ